MCFITFTVDLNVINMMKLRRQECEAGHVAVIGKTTWEDETISLRKIQAFRYHEIYRGTVNGIN
jgi:hypothetical protein